MNLLFSQNASTKHVQGMMQSLAICSLSLSSAAIVHQVFWCDKGGSDRGICGFENKTSSDRSQAKQQTLNMQAQKQGPCRRGLQKADSIAEFCTLIRFVECATKMQAAVPKRWLDKAFSIPIKVSNKAKVFYRSSLFLKEDTLPKRDAECLRVQRQGLLQSLIS